MAIKWHVDFSVQCFIKRISRKDRSIMGCITFALVSLAFFAVVSERVTQIGMGSAMVLLTAPAWVQFSAFPKPFLIGIIFDVAEIYG